MTLSWADAKRYLLLIISTAAAFAAVLLAAQPSSALYDSWPTGSPSDNGNYAFADPGADGVMNYVAPISAAANKSKTITIGAIRNGTTSGGSWASSTSYRNFAANRLVLVIQSTGLAAGTPTQCNDPIPNVSCSGGQTSLTLTNHQVGQFEVAKIQSISGSTITLTENLKNSYAATGAQVVAIPSFTTVTLAANRKISAQPWNGTSGGIVALMASGAVTMASGAEITASELGFRGGGKRNYSGSSATNCVEFDSTTGNQNGYKGEGIATSNDPKFYSPWTASPYAALTNATTKTDSRAMGNRANGGGGGDCENAGGGGGGNAGIGGQGGLSYDSGSEQWPVGGLGGQNLVYNPIDHAVLGGGGGSGDENGNKAGVGGNGGGLVFVRAGSLAASSGNGGMLTANGRSGIAGQNGGASTGNMNSGTGGASDGAGGGGGGGVVYARFAGAATCAGVQAKGGAGGIERSSDGVHGPGGGGGGGYVYFQRTSASGGCVTNSKAGAPGYAENGFYAGTSRGAGPASADPKNNRESDDPSAIGEIQQNPTAVAKPTATLSVPTANQVRPISSTVTGTSTANSTIDVYIDNVYSGSTISPAGSWTYTTPALAGGLHTIYVVPVRDNIAGDATASRSFSVDAYPPTKPTITTPASTLITNVNTPTIAGNVKNPGPYPPAGNENGASVAFYDGGVLLDTPVVTTNSSGNYSVTLPALSNGVHQITVVATDTNGNVSAPSDPRQITVDVTPAVVSFSTPADNAHVPTKRPTFTFTSDKAGTATCQIIGGAAATACSAAPSTWQVPATPVLAEGLHTAKVTFTDQAGNVSTATRDFTIDTIKPVVAITSPSADGTLMKSSRPSIAFSVTEINQSISECRTVGQSDWDRCDSPYTAPTLTDGSYTVEVRHTDKAGNTQAATRTIVVDTTLPTVEITKPLGSTFTGPLPQITFSVTEVHPGQSFCQIDTSVEIACSSPMTWATPLSAGAHNLAVRHEDAAGNKGPSATVSFIVDVTPPVVTIDWPPDGELINTRTPQVLFTLVEANPSPKSQCQIDSEPVVDCTSPWVPADDLADGPHTLVVSHTDKAGNHDSGSSDSVSFTVDATPPAAPVFDSGPGGAARLTNVTNATLVFHGAESGGTLRCQLDDLGWDSDCDSPQAFAGLALGEHSFFVQQIDDAGNYGAIATWTWTIDQTKPPAPNVSGPSGVSNAATETFTFYNAQQDVSFTCQLDEGALEPCDSLSYTTGTLSEENHTFRVWSTDPAGNVSDPTELAWLTDLNDFGVEITGAPSALSVLRNGSFLFTTTFPADGNTKFWCRVSAVADFDSTAATLCSSPFNYNLPADGTYKFGVLAKQGTEPTLEQTRIWTVDATPPTLTVSQPADGGSSGGNVSLLFSAADANTTGNPANHSVTSSCKLDNAPVISPCSSGQQFNNLPPGDHTVVVTATDTAGNETVVSHDWEVILAPPKTTFDSTPNANTNVATASFSFHANKTPSTFECSLDGAAFSACSSPTSFAVGEGQHDFRVRATNNGNTEPAPVRHVWTYSTTPPAAPNIAGGSRVLSEANSLTLRGTSDLGTKVEIFFLPAETKAPGHADTASNGNWELLLSSLPDGLYTVCAKATDAAGNVSPCSSSTVLVVDTTPPVVSISSPAEDAIVNTAKVTFSGHDATTAVHFECAYTDLTTGDESTFELCNPPEFVPDLVSGHRYTVTVLATDELENGATDDVTFTFDNTPPARPTIDVPDKDVTTNQTPVTISGAAEADSTVTVFVDGSARPVTTTATGSGTWSYTFSPDLAERPAPYEIHVTATDAAENVSEPSQTRKIRVDRTSPAKPTINTPVDGSGVPTARPTIGGTAEPNATVKLSIDGGAAVDAPVDVTGAWSHIPAAPGLANGTHTAVAKAVDAAGNESPDSDTTTFIVDNTTPTVVITSPENGSYLASTTVTVLFSVSDTPGDSYTVECRLNGALQSPCAPPSFTKSGLVQGPNTFKVTATDAGGNVATAEATFIVDTVAPAAPVFTAPAANSWMTGTQAIVRGTAEAHTTVHLELSGPVSGSVDVLAGSDSKWVNPFTGLTDGEYTVTAKATDAAGNESPVSSLTFNLDNTAPAAPTIALPVANDEIKSLNTVSGGNAEVGATVIVMIGNTSHTATNNGDGTWSATISPAYDTTGPVTITVTQRDRAGNTSLATTRQVTIDKTPPAVTIIKPVAGSFIGTNMPEFEFSATDASAHLTYECRVTTSGASTSYEACSSPWSPPSTLPEGSNTMQVKVTDKAGNVAQPAVTFTVDTVPPDTEFIHPLPGEGKPNNVDNRTAVSIGFKVVTPEPGVTFRCSLDGSAWVSCTSPRALSGLSEFLHTFKVKAVDQAGNEDPTPAEWSWTVDRTAPLPPVITQPTNNTNLTDTSRPQIKGTAEPDSVIDVRIDGTSRGTTTTSALGGWTFDFVGLVGVDCVIEPALPVTEGNVGLCEGDHRIEATATDAAGNESPASTAVNVTVDMTNPVIEEITQKPAEFSSDTSPLFAFRASEPVKFYCKLDTPSGPGTFQSCGEDQLGYRVTNQQRYGSSGQPPLVDGDYTFSVRGVDRSENTSPAVSWAWTVDTVPPTTTIAAAPGPLVQDADAEFAFTASEIATFECKLDGAAWSPCNASQTFPGLSDGPTAHTLQVRAIDRAGNVDQAPPSHSWVIDYTPPVGLVSQQPGSGANGAKAAFIISASDNVSPASKIDTFCSVDGSTPVRCGSPWTPAQTLAPGAHTLVVTWTDEATNSSTSQPLAFTQTTAPPPPPPPPPPAPDPGQCVPKGIAVTDLRVSGKRVRLAGFTLRSNAGKKIEAFYKPKAKKAAGKAIVAPDGSFIINFKAPAKKLWKSKKTAYRVKVGSATSGWTQLSRRMATTSASWKNGVLTVKGSVTKPLYPKAKATVTLRSGCQGKFATVGSLKISKSGKFSGKIKYQAKSPVAFVKVMAIVGSKPKKPKKIRTYSFVLPVNTP